MDYDLLLYTGAWSLIKPDPKLPLLKDIMLCSSIRGSGVELTLFTNASVSIYDFYLYVGSKILLLSHKKLSIPL